MDALIDASELCPVCGYALGFRPWDGESPSDEICPSCGIQYGYDDHAGGNASNREAVYQRWRQDWIEKGTPWASSGIDRPSAWRPREQLKRVIPADSEHDDLSGGSE
jgi:hypothetical protein